jgi:sulfoxide reductase heme-binding subunit YedZ
MTLSTKMMSRIKPVIFVFLLLPSLFWTYQFVVGGLGVNPIEKLMHNLGEFTLRLLIATLLLSSLANFKYLRSLQIVRRMIGLFAFYYVLLHLTTYVVLDHYFNWKFLLKDVLKRPFITLGFISFLLFIPLVLTSTKAMVRKLTYKVWKNIHKLIYVIAPLATMHFFLLTKADKKEPMIYLLIIFSLFVWRIFIKVFKH